MAPLYESSIPPNGNATKDAPTQAHEELQALCKLLRNQTAETIDAFIAENPTTAKAAKLALAAIMLKNTYVSVQYQQSLSPRIFDSRFLECGHRPSHMPKKERNWVHLLVNIIRHGIDEGTVTPSNKVSIVTFNYDMLLERVLDTQFQNRESPLAHHTNYVDIFHVHGQFGSIEGNCTDPGATAMAWAQGICVVKENEVPESVARARSCATRLIAEAQSVFAIGFSFAGPNCRLLGLQENRCTGEPPRLVYANYDGNRGVQESARRYFIGDNQEQCR